MLHGTTVDVPGDLSSAAFWLVLGSMIPGFEARALGVGLNPSRTGVIDVLRSMGCCLDVRRTGAGSEPAADVRVTGGRLRGVEISPQDVPSLQDELPVLAVAAAMAEGTTVVRGASELRHKESDRISATVENLRAMGARIEEKPDGFIIEGTGRLKGAGIRTRGDHRIAMAFAVAGLVAEGETALDDVRCIDISYPGFMDIVDGISAGGDSLDG
jgi:3-phosphoshikimate 1-carboxyvinyltransferase